LNRWDILRNRFYLQGVAEASLDRSNLGSHIPLMKPVSLNREPGSFSQVFYFQGGAPMEWMEIGATGGFLLGALAVIAAGGFMFFLGKNME
jgi:hypothetical protein